MLSPFFFWSFAPNSILSLCPETNQASHPAAESCPHEGSPPRRGTPLSAEPRTQAGFSGMTSGPRYVSLGRVTIFGEKACKPLKQKQTATSTCHAFLLFFLNPLWYHSSPPCNRSSACCTVLNKRSLRNISWSYDESPTSNI